MRDYARAGVSEYWIADALGDRVTLRILRLGADGAYVTQPTDNDGWLASPLYKCAVRLQRTTDRAGWVDYELELRT